MGKYGPGLSCRWALFTARAFGFKPPHLIFHRVELKKRFDIIFSGFDAFCVFMRTILNIEPYSPLKPTKVGFILIVPNSFSRAEDLAAVNHMTQAVV